MPGHPLYDGRVQGWGHSAELGCLSQPLMDFAPQLTLDMGRSSPSDVAGCLDYIWTTLHHE